MIYPRCKSDQNQVYVNSDGFYLPCCWIGNQPHLDEYRSFLGAELYEECDLSRNDLHSVLNGRAQTKLEASWKSETPFSACKLFCSRPLEREDAARKQGTNDLTRLSLE